MTNLSEEDKAAINTPSYQSSMKMVRLFKNENTGSITLTIIDDDSHGFRTFRFSQKDAKKLGDHFMRLAE